MAYEPYLDSGEESENIFRAEAEAAPVPAFSGLKRLTNLMASVVSLGLLIAIGIWGYNLVIRDVSGIPVVRAVEGEMRIRPETPGGELAEHQGLAVNAVVAEGEAAKPADRLVLAPQPVKLTEEDIPMDKEAVAFVQQAIADQLLVPAPESAAADPEPVEQLSETETEVTQVDDPLAEAPGIKVSLRPVPRPIRDNTNDAVAAAVAAAVASGPKEIDPASLESGTRLAQLGAFDSADQARDAWGVAQGRFGDLMSDKSRVVQQASSGGQVFYRLRAHGFEDLSAANRFCAAIVAEGRDCIPVVTR